jgi:UDP-N-acetylglucosamine--N-acetylmuramyl-(pentapeptide) pyrophosphoryl-undecaprenol N-acetylglucosamine transferase
MKFVITGGGTGGHLVPALAVVDAIKRRDSSVDILFIGSTTGLEAEIVPNRGIAYKSIATGKLRRSSRGLLGMLTIANFRDMLAVPKGLIDAYRILRTYKPDVILSTGGYVAVPASIAAWLLRIPLVVHEQTTTIGLANRLCCAIAHTVALSFDIARDDLPLRARAGAVLTGNPIRRETLSGSPVSAAARFGIPVDTPVLLITGGAQGARVINTAISDAISEITKTHFVIHQCGKQGIESLTAQRESLPDAIRDRWFLSAFLDVDSMADAWSVAQLVIARAGAGTVNEALILGKPMIFVPLEPSSRNEQLRNAERSVELGAAVIVRQSMCTGDALIKAICTILTTPGCIEQMATAAKGNAILDADIRITNILMEIAAK